MIIQKGIVVADEGVVTTVYFDADNDLIIETNGDVVFAVEGEAVHLFMDHLNHIYTRMVNE